MAALGLQQCIATTDATRVTVNRGKCQRVLTMSQYLSEAYTQGHDREAQTTTPASIVMHEHWADIYSREDKKRFLQVADQYKESRRELAHDDSETLVERWKKMTRARIEGLARLPRTICIDHPAEQSPLERNALNSVHFENDENIHGFVSAQTLVDLLERLDGYNEMDDIQLAGATYGKCPEELLKQLTALQLGIFLPSNQQIKIPTLRSCNSDFARTTAYQNLWHLLADGMIQANLCKNSSHLTIGTMLDCWGTYRNFADDSPHPFTQQALRGKECIIPGTVF